MLLNFCFIKVLQVRNIFGSCGQKPPYFNSPHESSYNFRNRMGGHVHKQYMRILSKWPVDKNKGYTRNLKYALENEVNRLHNPRITADAHDLDEPLSGKNVRHEANMKALQDIIDNQHQRTWPCTIKTGMFGLNSAQLAKVNADSFRTRLGLGATRWTFFTSFLKSDKTASN